jgi:hypothetical protein
VADAKTLQDAKMFSQSVTKGEITVKPEAEETQETTATDDSDMI